ncbi:MAG TPA: DUF5655 domain-containing protein [Phycisphaerae bacterium]|nr:DUF5655 domain-containing protein [Phycisphaerae bacterium]
MPLFEIVKHNAAALEQSNFATEKELQSLVERNLGTIFNCRLVASEYSTGAQHAGRIDTLALSEDGNPVIIEYKRSESSDLVNQSLFYLSWIDDHRGDFELAAQRSLGGDVEVDWSNMRVICIAPNFRKYDLHAVQVMGANIELWQYRLYAKGLLYLEEVYRKSYAAFGKAESSQKNPVMVEAGRKAAITRASARYSFEKHTDGKPKRIRDLALSVEEFIMGLDPAMEEVPKKLYVAYRISQNIACMIVHKGHVTLFLKIDPKDVTSVPFNSRDVSGIGHYGTGDFEMVLKSQVDLDAAKPFIEMAYRKVGG